MILKSVDSVCHKLPELADFGRDMTGIELLNACLRVFCVKYWLVGWNPPFGTFNPILL
jgi:hypothetical protein